jgi:hypothetical protein
LWSIERKTYGQEESKSSEREEDEEGQEEDQGRSAEALARRSWAHTGRGIAEENRRRHSLSLILKITSSNDAWERITVSNLIENGNETRKHPRIVLDNIPAGKCCSTASCQNNETTISNKLQKNPAASRV